MRFMIFVPADQGSEAGEMPSTELLDAMARYNQELVEAGVMVDGNGLRPSAAGARVRFDGDAPTVVEGPFNVADRLVAGYWIFECDSRDEAIEWLKRAPFDGGTEIELRPVAELDDFDEQLTPEIREVNEQLARDIQQQNGAD